MNRVKKIIRVISKIIYKVGGMKAEWIFGKAEYGVLFWILNVSPNHLLKLVYHPMALLGDGEAFKDRNYLKEGWSLKVHPRMRYWDAVLFSSWLSWNDQSLSTKHSALWNTTFLYLEGLKPLLLWVNKLFFFEFDYLVFFFLMETENWLEDITQAPSGVEWW